MSYVINISIYCALVVILGGRASLLPGVENERSEQYIVTVEGLDIPVYTAEVDKADLGGPYSFAGFELKGRTKVVVTSVRPLDTLRIRPISLGIKPEVEGNQATMYIDKPVQLSFEVNGIIQPLHIFADPPETDIPSRNDPSVLWYGPGIHRPDGGKISLHNGQTLYLERGAIVKAGIKAEGARDIRIMGRGILDGSDWPHWAGPFHFFTEFNNCTNITIEGVIFRGAYHWTVAIIGTVGVEVNNVKLLGGRVQNDDGFDLCNVSKVRIRNSFIRCDDDCIAIKGKHDPQRRRTEDIKLSNLIFWCDRARVILIGHESQTPVMSRISAIDCHVLHTGLAPILLEPGEDCVMEDVRFENWTIDVRYGLEDDLIRLRPLVNEYMQNRVPGHIKNIVFKDIAVLSFNNFRPIIMVSGADETHKVTAVKFQNVTIDGIPFPAKRIKVNKFSEGVSVLLGAGKK